MFRKEKDIIPLKIRNCHGGEGILSVSILFDNYRKGHELDFKSEHGLTLMHKYILPLGVSIGVHEHTDDEEIYYLVEGECLITMDDEKTPMRGGDISVLQSGHSHGIINTGTSEVILLVIGVKKQI